MQILNMLLQNSGKYYYIINKCCRKLMIWTQKFIYLALNVWKRIAKFYHDNSKSFSFSVKYYRQFMAVLLCYYLLIEKFGIIYR
jgi:hypothetical protein